VALRVKSVKVIDRGWTAMFKRLQKIKGMKVKVGVLADDKRGGLHHKGRDGKSSPLTTAELAAVLEFGTQDKKIPARPALGATFDAQRDELVAMGIKLMTKVILGETTIEKALGIMGAYLTSETKKYITTTPLPGIAPHNEERYARQKLIKGSGKKKYKVEGDVAYDKETGNVVHAEMLVRTWVDTGRLVNAFTWMIDREG
jgi:hypothetical protein